MFKRSKSPMDLNGHRHVRQQVLLLVCLLACSVVSVAEPLRIVASIKPLALIARDVVGHNAEVSVLVPPGTTPHDYALKPSDRVALADADMVVWLGAGLESFLVKPIKALTSKRVLTIGPVLGSEQRYLSNRGIEHGHADGDLHTWLDPSEAIHIASQIAGHLCQLRPYLCAELDENLGAVSVQYTELTKSLTKKLAPVKTQPVIVWHRGFDSFVTAFELNLLASVSENPEVPPGAKRLIEVTKLVDANPDIKCMWQEGSHKSPTAETFAKRWGLALVYLDILGSKSETASYVQLMRRVVDQITTACQ